MQDVGGTGTLLRNVTILHLVPLVQVAWRDGTEAERAKIQNDYGSAAVAARLT